jgi:DNA invertase Pin-like site-specific DNA recombinase
LIKERQREGIEIAKKKGVYKGRKKALSADKVVLLKQRATNGEAKTYLAKEFGISRETLYQYLKTDS